MFQCETRQVAKRALLLTALLAGACAPTVPTAAPGIPVPAADADTGAGAAARPSAGPAAPVAPFALLVDSIMAAPPLDRTHWGVHVLDPATGATVYERNPDLHFIPASNVKLVVAAAALDRLGVGYRHQTLLRTRRWLGAALDTIDGLLVVGSGDPTWSARFHDSDFHVPAALADSLYRTGVRTVVGDIVIDASRFQDSPVHPAWEIGDLPYGYAAPTDAFAIAEGTFLLAVAAGARPGAPGTARVIGDGPGGRPADLQPVAVTVETDTLPGVAVRAELTARRDTIHAQARIGAGRQDTVRLAVTQPALYAARAFAVALAERGIAWTGAIRVVRDSVEAAGVRGAHAEPLANWASAPAADVVAAILQPSQNWIAEQLLKTLGAELGAGGSWAGGVAAAREFLTTVVGLDPQAFRLRDASGLSAQNLLTPRAVTTLLAHARVAPWGATFQAALARPGGVDGTLERRLTSLDGRLAAKTGTITNVAALSGYVTDGRGRQLVFSIMTNGTGLPAATVQAAIDAIVEAIANGGGS